MRLTNTYLPRPDSPSAKNTFAPVVRRAVKPALNSLAILRTCHQIKREAESLWPSRVLFNFKDTATMLNKLSAQPSTTVAEIRHLRFAGGGLYVQPDDFLTLAPVEPLNVLRLLPALNLDRLTMLAPPRRYTDRIVLDTITHGSGWKELRFIDANPKMLTYGDPLMHLT